MKQFLQKLNENSGLNQVEVMIRFSISEEQKAVADYKNRAEVADMLGYPDVAEMFRDIAKEEEAHIGEHEAMLLHLGLFGETELMQGAEETAELLDKEEGATDVKII